MAIKSLKQIINESVTNIKDEVKFTRKHFYVLYLSVKKLGIAGFVTASMWDLGITLAINDRYEGKRMDNLHGIYGNKAYGSKGE